MDKDAEMISILSNALINLQVKYRGSLLEERMRLLPELKKLLARFNDFQLELLKEGIITTEEDLKEMRLIKVEVDQAGNTQQLLAAIGKTVGFIVLKV